jgi:hypothetical protein
MNSIKHGELPPLYGNYKQSFYYFEVGNFPKALKSRDYF